MSDLAKIRSNSRQSWISPIVLFFSKLRNYWIKTLDLKQCKTRAVRLGPNVGQIVNTWSRVISATFISHFLSPGQDVLISDLKKSRNKSMTMTQNGSEKFRLMAFINKNFENVLYKTNRLCWKYKIRIITEKNRINMWLLLKLDNKQMIELDEMLHSRQKLSWHRSMDWASYLMRVTVEAA